MAQDTEASGPGRAPFIIAKNSVVIPATGDTDLLTVDTLGMKTLGAAFDVTVNALDAFKVLMKFHRDDSWRTIYTGITSTPGGLVIAASGTLATTAAGSSGWLILDVRGVWAVKFTGSGSVADTTAVAIKATASA